MGDVTCDVVVVGAGASGMTAAATAAAKGQQVVVVEKTPFVGGNTSFSGGMVYIPNNDKMAQAGAPDDPEMAMAYLDATVPTEDGRSTRQKFVDKGPEAIRFLEANTSVKLKPVPFYPDYYPGLEGAAEGKRVLEPEAFDAASLGDWFKKLRPPIPEFTILGGMMVAREDLPHFRNMWRSPRAFARATYLVVQHRLQRLKHHRGSRLVLGNALAGRLLKSLLDLGVDVRTDTEVLEVVVEQGRATGLMVRQNGQALTINARKGVILSTGGLCQ